MSEFILGIDPGAKKTGKAGGFALIEAPETGRNVLHVHGHLPCTGAELQLRDLADMMESMCPIEGPRVFLEQVGAQGKDAATAMFTFGRAYGSCETMAKMMAWQLTLVRPQLWKKEVLYGTPKDKNAAIAFARRTYPGVNLCPGACRADQHDIADAVCIAEYGARVIQPVGA